MNAPTYSPEAGSERPPGAPGVHEADQPASRSTRALRVVVVGGTGNYGGYVARSLADDPAIQLIITGRSNDTARAAADALGAHNCAKAGAYDLAGPPEALAALRPDLVINAVGPYHDQGYAVARAAIGCRAHYCDLADAREFVCGIGVLDQQAKAAGVAVIAGASSIPALTAAYCDEAVGDGVTIDTIECGISGAQQSNQGVGTAAGALHYVGERFTRLKSGAMHPVTGWSDSHRVAIPTLGHRWFANANAPDLELFKQRYRGLTEHAFYAGHEIALLHFATRLLGTLRSLRLLPRLDRLASTLVPLSQLFNGLGRGESALFMRIAGITPDGAPYFKRHFIIVRDGMGPYIPCIPVVHIAKQLSVGGVIEAGARPCLGLISLKHYKTQLALLNVKVIDQ